MIEEGPYIMDLVENCPEDEAWACIQETADVPETENDLIVCPV